MNEWRHSKLSMETALIAAVCLSMIMQLTVCGAVEDVKPDLVDDYLEREFDWAMLLDTHDMPDHFSYPGSRLRPLSKVRVKYRSFRRDNESNLGPSKMYEELWYHQQTPVGLRRFMPLKIEPDRHGAVIIRKPDSYSSRGERFLTLANALIRLLVDLQLKQIDAGVVLVPHDEYDAIAEALRSYRFEPHMQVAEGKQMSIHLRAYPQGKDEYFYFQK